MRYTITRTKTIEGVIHIDDASSEEEALQFAKESVDDDFLWTKVGEEEYTVWIPDIPMNDIPNGGLDSQAEAG